MGRKYVVVFDDSGRRGVFPHDFVMGYRYAAIFDGWGSASIPVVDDDDIVVAHDESRGTLDESELKSSTTTT